jgi:hypothetical protein
MKNDAWKSLSQICKNDSGKSICLVIGAGIHNLPGAHKKLAKGVSMALVQLRSWDAFLGKLFPRSIKHPSIPPTVHFEMECLKQSSELSAKESEIKYLKCAANKIQQLEECALNESQAYRPLVALCMSNLVSDIISLNIDLVCERLLLLNKKIPHPIESDNIKRHRIISGKKIWHPHGDWKKPRNIHLSLREYSKSLAQVEKHRQIFKAREGLVQNFTHNAPHSWVDLFQKCHIIFIGTSVSEAEYDIWFALINRFRNFAKKENKLHEPKTFVLTKPCDHRHFPSNILRLEEANYCLAWDRIVKTMNSKSWSMTAGSQRLRRS